MDEETGRSGFTVQRLHDYQAFSDFVLDRYRAYLDATRLNGYDPRGRDIDGWYVDSATGDPDPTLCFTGRNDGYSAFEEYVSLSVLDIWTMTEAEFKASLPRFKKGRQDWVKAQQEAQLALERERLKKNRDAAETAEKTRREKIFREEARKRGIEVPR